MEEGAAMKPTDIPCVSGDSTGRFGTNLAPTGVIKKAIEGIFQDLFVGVRVEEKLKHQDTTMKWDRELMDAGDDVIGEKPMEINSSYDRWIKELSTELMDEAVKAELADAMAILEAVYWLDCRYSSEIRSSFHHPILSNYHKEKLPQSIDIITENVKCMQFLDTTTPNPTVTQQISTFERYHSLSKAHGWKLLTLLSLSRSFRSAASDLSAIQWQSFLEILLQNKGSFELICKTVRPQYGILLINLFRVLRITESIAHYPSDAWITANNWIYIIATKTSDKSEARNLEDPMDLEYLNHPHRWFVAVDKKKIKPVNPVYIPIKESLFHAQDYTSRNDPRSIPGNCAYTNYMDLKKRETCELCETRDPAECSCPFVTQFPEPLVEIIETDGKGLGVRSLQSIEKGSILGEYAGLIRKDATKGDVYSLNGHLGTTDEDFYLTTSKDMGNFTRFVNHSCSPNCFYSAINFRGKNISILVAVEEIGLFDEITADYGEEYFVRRGMDCKCGTESCTIHRELI